MWITPAEATAGYDKGELLMMPPTVATLRGLAECATAAEALASASGRDMTPVLARARLSGDEVVLSWPGHDEFTKRVASATPATPSDPTGEPRMTDAAALPGQPRGGVLSGPATARAVNVLAPNASAMTLDGTNTWILAEPDSDLAVVVDPGPLDDAHLRHVVDTAGRAGKRVALTLLTHGHPDHAEGAARFAELTGTNVRALDPALRLGDEGLAAGDVIGVGGLELRVVATPGHTADSCASISRPTGRS